jgi:hypothetical protein
VHSTNTKPVTSSAAWQIAEKIRATPTFTRCTYTNWEQFFETALVLVIPKAGEETEIRTPNPKSANKRPKKATTQS